MYSSFNSIDSQLRNYSDQKAKVLFPLLDDLSDKELEEWIYENNTLKFFQLALRNNGYRKFLITGGSVISHGYMDEVLDEMSDLILEMERYGY